jgi:hypothetical protein
VVLSSGFYLIQGSFRGVTSPPFATICKRKSGELRRGRPEDGASGSVRCVARRGLDEREVGLGRPRNFFSLPG